MKKRKSGFAAKNTVIIAVLFFIANIILGIVLINESRNALKTLIHNRMLDISNTAADMINGDELKALKKEDKGTAEYQKINDTLAVFQENIDLKYIYCIKPLDDTHFVFSVDPTIEDPGEFGSPIVYTEALAKAAKGTPSVDNEPYSDAWGNFYSAYTPVFDSKGEVAGIVAVDFDADWFDAQIAKQSFAIAINCIVVIIISVALIIIFTSRTRKQMKAIQEDLADVAADIDELNSEMNSDFVPNRSDQGKVGNVSEIARSIHGVREGLRKYKINIHSEVMNMINALASDYRGLYYIELDTKKGVCYQSRSDLSFFNTGDTFDYLEALTDYCNKYVLEQFREEFLKVIQPEYIRETLKENRVISYKYMTNINGVEAYEVGKFAPVTEPGGDGEIHNVGACFIDVDYETRAELEQRRALNEALAEAEQANKAKTVFLSNMSHEIRTPMNAIIGLNNIALSEPDISDNLRENLEKTASSAQHLLEIINEILDMSRIESGRMTINNEEFSFKKNIEQVNTIIGGQCSDKGVEYECKKIGNIDDYYVGDDTKLKQIMINILGNSVKFTPKGGKITFLIEEGRRYEGKAMLRLTFKDNGIGMSEEFVPHIFDAFSQENASSGASYGSTGLGMPITKSLVELMNGHIEVESKKGEGTIFTVTVTLGESERKNDAPTEDKSEAVDLTGKRILLAEDMSMNAEIIIMILNTRGIEVDHAENGRIAVEKFKSNPDGYYDAILMDMRMPETDGLEATKIIRETDSEYAQKIPIIALTANAFEEDVQRSLQSGLNAHLSKPIQPETLFETLEGLIK